MPFNLFDDQNRFQLLPFTHTRPVADIRCGILTMRERWEKLMNQSSGTLTEPYLQRVFPLKHGNDSVFINASVFATEELAHQISNLKEGEKLIQNEVLIACRFSNTAISYKNFKELSQNLSAIDFNEKPEQLKNIWDIFSKNETAIARDFKLLTTGRKTAPIPEHVIGINPENIFLEEGAKVNAGCILNPAGGFIYIGKEAEVLEGCMLRGSVALCEHAVLKMGAKIYGATTLGPGCKVGGEISNVVFFANSNKGHDGYLGNSVIGEWCNLGADTNCSNLKNNYDSVKIWDEARGKSIHTGLQFCGLLMADHSKCGINTMFNTGTVTGVSANIFGGGFPEKFIPSFAWGGSEGMSVYRFDRAMETAGKMMARRNRELSSEEIDMFRHIFDATEPQRKRMGLSN